MKGLVQLIYIALFILSSGALAKVNSLELIKHDKFNEIVISPDGKHLAVTYREDTEIKLAIINRKSNKVISGFDYGEYRRIVRPQWLSNERILFNVVKFVGLWDTKGYPPQVMAANIDGTRRVNLTDASNTYFSISSLLPENENEILIQVPRFEAGKYKAKLHRLNVLNGRKKFVSVDIPYDVKGFFTDQNGNARAAYTFEVDEKTLENSFSLYYRSNSGAWSELKLPAKVKNPEFNYLGMSSDETSFFFTSDFDDPESRLHGLYEFNINTQKVELLKRHDYVDIEPSYATPLAVSPNGYVTSVSYDDGEFKKIYLDDNHWYSKLVIGFDSAFKNSKVNITSITKDKKEAVISVSSDNNPGAFYIYNSGTRKLKQYGKSKYIDSNKMASVKGIKVKARDGLDLYGYLTLPKGTSGKVPLVVKVHGGPHGPRDYWGWDDENQLLAANGYGVLQINFRGSGGYGRVFEEIGHRKWGAEMQDDITDATLWAIDQGVTDKESICIYGGSYGGYASAMAVVREPDLYKCAIPYVGVYSLPVMKVAGDIPRSRSGKVFLDKVLGENEEDLLKRSPAHNVGKIKADLFIAHGSADLRCPMEQYDALTKALDKVGKKYKSMVRDEGHGYQIQKNMDDFYSELVKFLDKNLK